MDRPTHDLSMDQLISRNNRHPQQFDEADWTVLGWQNRQMRDGTETRAEDSNKKNVSRSDTLIGVVYVGVLVIFMTAYLT